MKSCRVTYFSTSDRGPTRMMNQHPTQASVGPQVATGRAISRRSFLRGGGVVLSLPLLDAMVPGAVGPQPAPRRKQRPAQRRGECWRSATTWVWCRSTSSRKRRGADYKPSPYLEMLAEHKNDFTVFSGVWHPDVDGGHPADNCFLTAAPHPGSGGFRNTISLDQFIAERLGHLTRFPSLTLGVNVRAVSAACPGPGPACSFRARRRLPTSSAACSSRARPPRPRRRSPARAGRKHPRRGGWPGAAA